MDMEYYDWKLQPSYQSYMKLKAYPSQDTSQVEKELDQDPLTNKYAKAVSDLFNQGMFFVYIYVHLLYKDFTNTPKKYHVLLGQQ